MLLQLIAVQHFLIVDAIAAPQRLTRFQLFQVGIRQADKDIVRLQITLNIVFFNALADDLSALLYDACNKRRGVLAIAPLNRLQRCVQPVHHLTAIAARGAPADARAFNHDNGIAFFRQMQRSGQAGIARAHDADVGLNIALQRRPIRRWVRGCRVIACRMGAGPGVWVILHHTVSK